MPLPIVLAFVGYYLPGYKSGGPLRTVSNMVDHLGDEIEFRIITSDRDSRDKIPYSSVNIDSWNEVGKAKVKYLSPNKRYLKSYVSIMNETKHDILYLNSFFSFSYTLLPLIARRLNLIPKRPTIVAPRGEFSRGAYSIKHFKKSLYVLFLKYFGLINEITWQASSKYEADDIQKALGKFAESIIIATNLPSFSDNGGCIHRHNSRNFGDPLKICFLSRISPMKNLDYALKVLAHIRVPVEMDIYGSISDGNYWNRCKTLIDILPNHVTVRYLGIVEHSNIIQTMTKYDLFFLPTRGENYGHVIFEALSAGLPVLISDQTPWRNLESDGVGWDIPLDNIEPFCKIIESQSSMNSDQLLQQREQAINYAMKVTSDKQALLDNINLFRNTISR